MRIWRNHQEDDGSIHSLGNGRMCAYGQGPNLIQVFGPPYSSPSLCGMYLQTGMGIGVESGRESGTAIWTHQLQSGCDQAGEIIDFVDSQIACLVRILRLSQPLDFRLVLAPGVTALRTCVLEGQDGLLLSAPPGTYLYHNYPFPAPIFLQIAWQGPVSVQIDPHSSQVELVCGLGESCLLFAGGPDYPAAIQTAETALETTHTALLQRTRQSWRQFSAGRTAWPARLPADTPHRQALLEAVDDTAVLIKTQQAQEGAVLAGHNYHLGYVRDQYGVARGLLAMGHIQEARRILEFYASVWQQHGRIHNAQAAGVDGVFHVHENDEVEITGYLIQQAFDLLSSTNDSDFTRAIFPMLEWAWQAQKKHLVQGMLPFNGDETYVAGGILPRHTLNDGSAEATLLFLESGKKLLGWAARHKLWTARRVAAERRVLQAVQSAYRANFWENGQIITNNPRRAEAMPADRHRRFRHGVCERCAAEGRHHGIEWTERNEHGRYLCPTCLVQPLYPAAPPRIYRLQSVSLIPFYLRASLFSLAELAPGVESILASYRASGQLPSRPEETDHPEADPTGTNISVGYDYGLLLYALTELCHPAGADLYAKTLSMVDSTGAWVEYYQDHHPCGTRCRPWESAINLEALLRWAGSHP